LRARQGVWYNVQSHFLNRKNSALSNADGHRGWPGNLEQKLLTVLFTWICLLGTFLQSGCKVARNGDGSSVNSSKGISQNNSCIGSAKILLQESNGKISQARGSLVEPPGVSRIAGESVDSYHARLEKTLRELGGSTDLAEMAARNATWEKIIKERLQKIDGEVKVPKLRKDGKMKISDAEFATLSSQFERSRGAYLGMMDFFNSGGDLHKSFREIEIKVRIEMKVSNVNHDVAVETVFRRVENKAGFAEAVDLPAEFVTPKQLLEIVREGKPIRDLFFANFTGKQFHHGIQTHRLQFVAIFMDMENNPGRYFKDGLDHSAEVGALFRFIGDERLVGRLEFRQPVVFESIFGAFDSMEFNDGTSPEFLRELYIRGVGGENSLL
jgi:hypothetical protein